MTQRFSADPDPVQAGGKTKVCYDFSSGGGTTSPVTVVLDYDSPTPDKQITLSAAQPCQDVDIPAGATGLLLVDSSGQSEDYAVTIQA